MMGQTLSYMINECEVKHLLELTPTLVKQKCRYFPTPAGEMWRIPVIQECLDIMSGEDVVSNFLPDDFKTLLDSLCTDKTKST